MPCPFCHDEGWICQLHRRPRGHDGCDEEVIEPCPGPACRKRGKRFYDEIFATTDEPGEDDDDEEEEF
jgi:hypothetical protein